MGVSRAHTTLNFIESELIAAKNADNLNDEGLRLLNLVQSPSVHKGGMGAFSQGLTLYFSDEIVAGISHMLGSDNELTRAINKRLRKGGKTPLDPYGISLAPQRRDIKKYKSESPVKALSSELAGAVIPGVFSRGRTLPSSLGIATGTGAVAGAGSSEGGLASRLTGGLEGGAFGLGTQAGLKGVGHLLKKGWQGIVSPGAARRGQIQAENLVRDAVESDVGTLSRGVANVAAGSKPVTLADLGPNTRSLTDAAAILPGKGKTQLRKFLANRDKQTTVPTNALSQ